MAALIVNSKQSLAEAVAVITATFEKDKYLSVSINSGKRTLDQNALIHLWYSDVAKEDTIKDTPFNIECQFKYQYGLYVLGQDEDHKEYVAMIREKLKLLHYEERIAFMKYVPVTSLMSTKQLSEYGNTMQIEMAKEGIILDSNRKK